MIAIIMAVYNGEAYLREQIDSLLDNSRRDVTIHIFDDGSADRSADIIAEYQECHPEKIFYYRNTKNRGVIRNFLEGCQDIDADYYMFCDQDDVWLPEKIPHTLAKMQAAESSFPEKPLVVFGDARVVDEDLQEIHPSFQRQSGYRTDLLDLPHILMENKLIGCTILFNRSLKNLLSDIPDSLRMHDWWIALIASALGRIIYLDEPLLLYRQHAGNVVGGSTKASYIKNRLANLSAQRKVLYDTCAQAQSFLDCYQSLLTKKQQHLIHTFATIPQANWFARRYRVLRYHFLKSGLARNLGILLVI
ncbi:MAG: glycosyltransferase family 2 protein [Lachnospiraceae bacterium]|nr:glycosyltransferase family 2 protein [Lachnospiraceae bacterium]